MSQQGHSEVRYSLITWK